MTIIEVNKHILEAYEEILMPLFEKYYLAVNDIVTPSSLWASLPERLEKGAIILLWGEDTPDEGFIIADSTVNVMTHRKEGFIWTVYNPKPEFKGEVLDRLDSWAKSKGLEALVFMAEKPIAFNKLIKDFGYRPTIGFFEKEVS